MNKLRVTPTVNMKFQAPNLNNINCVNNMFEDKEFCVLNDCETMSKSEIEKKIYEHGGRVVQNPGKNYVHFDLKLKALKYKCVFSQKWGLTLNRIFSRKIIL